MIDATQPPKKEEKGRIAHMCVVNSGSRNPYSSLRPRKAASLLFSSQNSKFSIKSDSIPRRPLPMSSGVPKNPSFKPYGYDGDVVSGDHSADATATFITSADTSSWRYNTPCPTKPCPLSPPLAPKKTELRNDEHSDCFLLPTSMKISKPYQKFFDNEKLFVPTLKDKVEMPDPRHKDGFLPIPTIRLKPKPRRTLAY